MMVLTLVWSVLLFNAMSSNLKYLHTVMGRKVGKVCKDGLPLTPKILLKLFQVPLTLVIKYKS